MGIRDFFKRKNKDQKHDNYERNELLTLDYGNGKFGNVSFGEIVQQVRDSGETKYLQKVGLTYTESGRDEMVGNNYLMEVMYDPEGRCYDQKQYYEYLLQYSQETNQAVKSFFNREEVESLPSDYIGGIYQLESGKLGRTFDYSFKEEYDAKYQKEKIRKSMPDLNEVYSEEQMAINYSVKDSHAVELNQQMKEESLNNIR